MFTAFIVSQKIAIFLQDLARYFGQRDTNAAKRFRKLQT